MHFTGIVFCCFSFVFGFVCKSKARLATGIKITTHFLVMPALSRRSGTRPEVPLRYVCVPTSGSCQPQAHSPVILTSRGLASVYFLPSEAHLFHSSRFSTSAKSVGPASGASWHPLCPGELSAEFISVARFPFGRWIQIEMRSKSICSHVLSANQTQGGL